MPLFTPCWRLFLAFFFLTGFAYPALVTLSGYLMPEKAQGSLVYSNEKQPRGSLLIAQKFSQERYFWPRPSAVDYQTLPSGGSNLAPTSQKLKDSTAKKMSELGVKTPPQLLFNSASGLDPHISLEAAFFQMERIAKARSLSREIIEKLILNHIEGRQLGLIGPYYVNVLRLNQELDRMAP